MSHSKTIKSIEYIEPNLRQERKFYFRLTWKQVLWCRGKRSKALLLSKADQSITRGAEGEEGERGQEVRDGDRESGSRRQRGGNEAKRDNWLCAIEAARASSAFQWLAESWSRQAANQEASSRPALTESLACIANGQPAFFVTSSRPIQINDFGKQKQSQRELKSMGEEAINENFVFLTEKQQ